MTRTWNHDEEMPGKEAQKIAVEFSNSPQIFRGEESTPSRNLETKSNHEFAQVQVAVESKESASHPKQIAQRYSVLGVLGIGGQGAVYLAEDTTLGRKVAIKISKPGHVLSSGEREQFQQEAKAIAALKHPGIVTVHDFGIHDDGRCFIVLEYLPGESLKACLKKPDAPQVFTLERTLRLITCVAEALHYSHRHGIYHRDLKPGNILLDEHGNPHISDFGLAVTPESQRELKGQIAGTAPYMSPEQVRGETQWLNGQSDIWALGVILYEMLARKRPFLGATEAEVQEEILSRTPAPLRQTNDHIPRILDEIVAKCLAKNESARYQTAGDVAVDLGNALALSLAASPDAADGQARIAPSPAKPSRRSVPAAFAMFAGIGVLALTCYFVIQTWVNPPGYGEGGNGISPTSLSTPPGTLGSTNQPNAESNPSITAHENNSPPNFTSGLLSQEPVPLIFHAQPGESPLHNGPKQEFWVPKLRGNGLWTLGRIDHSASDFTYEVDLEQVPWSGGIGIFFGCRPVGKPEEGLMIYQLISLEPKIKEDEKRAFSLKRTCVIRSAKGEQHIVSMETPISEEVPRPEARRLRLLIVGRKGKISTVSLGNRIFHTLAYDDLECSLGSLEYHGQFGLYLDSIGQDQVSGRFLNAIFHQP